MRTRRGFILLLAALSLAVLLGATGLALDGARLFAIRNEVRSHADLAALTAARELDGTAVGIERARAAAAGLPGSWSFGGETFAAPAVEYWEGGAWSPGVRSPKEVRRVRVTVSSGVVPLLFAALTAPMRDTRVTARAAGEAVEPFDADPPVEMRSLALAEGPRAEGEAVDLTPVWIEGHIVKPTPGLAPQDAEAAGKLTGRIVAVPVYGPPRDPQVTGHALVRLGGGLRATFAGTPRTRRSRLVE